jgi:endonuclease YncB( thermonuclease family)
MEGIDAPEKGMPFYRVSKDYLSGLCFNQLVSLDSTGKDDNRILAYSYLEDGRELGQEMLKSGMAWHFKKYNSDSILAQLEIEARNLKKGLWQDDNPMPPWVNKSLHKQGISTKDSFVTVDSDNIQPSFSN